MGDPTAFERLRGDPSEWPNEWPDHMMSALKRVADTHPSGFDYREEVRTISVPTLIVAGEVDRYPSLTAIDDWADTIPGARLVVLPGVGHFPQAEAPSGFFEAVDSFLL
jgi:pimeloyl-ACP methyl ester carboxylesterase